ncbi:MAG: tRNA (guanosine(37)-N1)-methyltransferase TrmD [Gammaproteobacteria bacterium]|nr:tRNA (guanosine(37)-N1)-methyltransferase TrmD [Gammaproteobacteria bacterium]
MTKPLQFQIISLFPEMFAALDVGIVGRAKTEQLIEIDLQNPRDFTQDTHRSVDDRPYGGGPGMVMLAEPVYQAIQAAKTALGKDAPVIYLSPKGKPLQHADIIELAKKPELILLAGRYEGIDQRLLDKCVDQSYSIGDFVLSGGELPVMCLVDAITRQLPGALGHPEAAKQDSFATGLLDCPHYTRPEIWHNQPVPKVLQGGNHAKIERWRVQQALINTWQTRPDLIKRRILNAVEAELLAEYQAEQEDQ